MLKIENLSASYDKKNLILDSVNLEIASGQIVGIVGRNGSGKSTLAKSILNMLPYITGNVFLKEVNIRNQSTDKIIRMGVGYFLQGGRVFPNLTIKENIIVAGSRLKKREIDNRKKQLSKYFEILENEEDEKVERKAGFLSGGEKSQLALIMALINSPEFLILDEPSAGLSQKNVSKLFEIINNLMKEEVLTIMLIEQNLEITNKVSYKVLEILNGKIINISRRENEKV